MIRRWRLRRIAADIRTLRLQLNRARMRRDNRLDYPVDRAAFYDEFDRRNSHVHRLDSQLQAAMQREIDLTYS